jgi:hypothetical protein
MIPLFKTLTLVVALTLVTGGGELVAEQQPATSPAPAKTGKAEISGVVFDSLHRRYLKFAEVLIDGVNERLVTDSTGRFRIAGIPPGTYQVGVFHPLLDTLGIALATRPFRAGPDSESIAILSVPSANTIIRGACPPSLRAEGNSAVIGHVNDPETLRPVSGAEVSIAWVAITISKEAGIHRTPHLVTDTTNAAGAFTLCGLPNSMDASLQARRGTAVTGQIPISLGGAATELFARTLLLSTADSGTKARKAAVSGTVILDASATNAGSRVELVGIDAIALTNEKGEFAMMNLPSGSHVLVARHLGYEAQTVPVDLTAREPQKVAIKLPRFVAMMDTVVVIARRNASLDRVGFNQRKRSGTGHYLGPEQLEKMHPYRLTDIFQQVPGLRVNYSGSSVEISSSRGSSASGCVQYFVDDMQWMSAFPGDINTFLSGSEIVAVEVYNASNTPARYTRAFTDCVTIVLWTRLKIRD